MRWRNASYFNIGPGLPLIFVALVALILGGNALLIWQFHLARTQTERLTGVNQQFISVLQLHNTLLSFHQRLDELAQSKDAHRLAEEAQTMRNGLLAQVEQARKAKHLPPETLVGMAFQPTLEAIEVALPSQLEAISTLAMSGDWEAVRLRLANDMRLLETQTGALVDNLDKEVGAEQSQAVANMTKLQARIVIIVPATAISTFIIAAVFGWAVTKRIMVLRLKERLGERARIARELHDTLLQSFHGLLFRFQAARNMLPRRTDEAMQALDGAITRAEQAIADSRSAIQGLRSESADRSELELMLTAFGNELAVSHDENCGVPVYRVVVEGAPRYLSSALQDEVYRIAREVLRNAFQHASARHIEVEIRYDAELFRMRVRDDGKGIDPKVLQEGKRPGHWGLPGVRERAKRIGAGLDFWSETEVGTEVQLTVPGVIAYKMSGERTGFWRFGRAKVS